MNWIKTAVGAAALGLLAACGGGGDAGASKFGSNDSSGGLSEVSNAQATQKSMSFSAEDYQLDWSSNGITTNVTVFVADTAGNPIPDGATMQFSVSGGQITQSCTVTRASNGASSCSVTFTTSNPRPLNGYVAVLAWLVGEEAYKDQNGNGKYDAGEPFWESGTIFRDDDVDGIYTPNVDEIVVSGTSDEGKIGVGTSACRQDVAAIPSEIPLSIPNTCDGVWGKTLVRVQAYFAVSDPRDLKVGQGLDDNGSPVPGEVAAYTEAPNGNWVAALTGTKLEVTTTLPSGCTASFLPNDTITSQEVGVENRQIVLTGTTCSSVSQVAVKATAGTTTATANINM